MGINDRFSKVKLRADDIVEIPEITAPSGNPGTDKGWLYCKDDSGTTKLYFENSGGTVTDLIATTTTAWDDISDPGANSTVDFTTFTQTFTSAGTAADMFSFEGTGNFGDVSLVKIEQKTGNPTDGTVLEVISADANADALVVTANSSAALVVGGDGNVAMANDLGVTGTATVGTLSATTFSTATLASDTGLITADDNMTIASGSDFSTTEGSVTVTDTANEAALVVASSATTANAVEVTALSTTGAGLFMTANDLGATGSMIYLDSDNIATDRYYLRCYDGSANDYLLSANGIATHTGAAGTSIINITAGDLNIDAGVIKVDAATDVASNITRNYNGAGTSPVLTVKDDHTASTNYALNVTQDGTGGACMLVDATGTTTNGIIFSVPASFTGQLIKVEDTLVGTTGEGCFIDCKTTANLASGATLVRLDFDTGTMAGATDGFMLSIDDDSVGVGTSYAVKIDSASNEALHVATGKAVFDEEVTLTGGANIDGGLDIDFSANTEKISIESTVVDLAAGDAWMTIHGDHAGNTNDAALLRLVYQADADAQDTFILCEDNSTGAAANGDDMFKVAAGGLVTAAGGVSPGPTSTSIQYSTTVTLSNANIKALRASPKELVATPGAGKWLELDSLTLILNYGSEVLTETADNLVVEYGTSGQDATAAIEATGFIDAGADQFIQVKGAGVTTACALANVVNNNLRLFNTGDGEYGGNVSNDTTMTAIIRYWIHDDTV